MTADGAGDITREIAATVEERRWADLDRHLAQDATVHDHRPGVADPAPTAAQLGEGLRRWCEAGPFEFDATTVDGDQGPVTFLAVVANLVAGFEIPVLAVLAASGETIDEVHLFDPHQHDMANAVFASLRIERGSA